MKRFIRYLYEYEQGKRIRNVGFVKVETGSERTTLHMQAKGFKEGSDRRLVLYLFYEDKDGLTSLCREQMTMVSPVLNHCMAYTRDGTEAAENYERIQGILLVTESGRRIAATWDDRHVDVSRVREFEPATAERGHEEEKSGQETQEELEMCPVTVEGRLEEANGGQETQEHMDSCPRGDATGCEKENEGHDAHENNKIRPLPAKRQQKITKIQRQDISKLPRCEWKLANNQFLIHGYNNYHYLVLIEDENVLKLGVPGIYHIKEEKYAEMFGFGEFLEEEETFGYWCRPVKQRQSRQHE